MTYVYLLRSELDNGFYIGCTEDLKNRFEQHTKGLVKSLSGRRPLRLVYYEAYTDSVSAFAREKKLKAFGSAYNGLLKRLNYK